eukprot:4934594-Amphidinium_carterae.2
MALAPRSLSSSGGADSEIALTRSLASDPTLTHLKLIAEPWDCDWPYGVLLQARSQIQILEQQ